MSDHVYAVQEIVGSSPESIEAAIDNALRRVRKSTPHLDWFVVTETRGHLVEGGAVGHYQVTLKVGSRLED